MAIDTVIILVYVDDILVTGSCFALVSHIIAHLHKKFSTHDLRELFYFLGIHVQYCGNTMHLSQTKYIQELLQRTHLRDSKLASTSCCTLISQRDGVLLFDPSEYRSVVGALQYVTLTLPDIVFVVNKACQFMARPTDAH